MALLVRCTKQNGNLLNGNHHHHHHHLEAKNFRIDKSEGFLTARASSIMSSSLKVKLCTKKCTFTSFCDLGMRSEGNAPKNGEPRLLFT